MSVDVLEQSHRNKAITVTGSQTVNSSDLIDLIFEISGVNKNVVFKDLESQSDHYSLTPYRYTPKQAHKLVPNQFIDLGQGVLELVEEINKEIDTA